VVAQVADQVAIMYLGNIIEQGSVREILKNPQHPYTVNLIEAVPRLGRMERLKALIPIRGNVPSLYDRPVGCPFATRCTKVIENRCEEAMPRLISMSSDHQVACFLYNSTGGETG
jgi:oligopeptide/dipeptide ABC transporter ATP-binding protein